MAKPAKGKSAKGRGGKSAASRSRSKPTAPKRDYKAEYARRIKNATARGKSRQQARGHKPLEHVERRVKSESYAEKYSSEIGRFAELQTYRARIDDPAVTYALMLDYVQQHGIRAFRAIIRATEQLNAQWIDEGMPTKPGLYDLTEMDAFARAQNAHDTYWLFYH